MFFDTHVHFDVFGAAELDAVIGRAVTAGVERMLAVGSNAEANQRACEIASRRPGQVWAAVGYDRDQATSSPSLTNLETMLARPRVVAVGEIGLDYHYRSDTAAAQRELFAAQLDLARRHRLPVVVHSREADRDTLDLLTQHARQWPGDPPPLGVLHCFTGTATFARKLLDLGLLIGFSGILTFRNAGELRETARRVPDDRLLIETDTPYLAPALHRGEPNEPAWVVCVAEALAKIRNDSLAHIAHTTTANAEALFSTRRAGTP